MQPKIIKFDADNPDIAKIKQAAQLIDNGMLVAIPTETVYGIACRVKNDSLIRLNSLKGRTPEKHYTLHIGQRDDVKKYVPTISLKAQKLIKNAWPGPLTIVFELNKQDINKQKSSLNKDVFKNLYKDNSIGIRCPENSIASILLQHTLSAVVAPSANITGQSPAVDAQGVLTQLSGQIDLLLDAGPSKYKKSSTVVKIAKEGLEILRSGIYSQPELEVISTVRFLFICTGNTCRSPIAEAMFTKYLAEKLGCELDHLDKIGYKVSSAGTMGLTGVPVSLESAVVCADKGIDIKAQKSTALSRRLLEESDFIFVMSRIHRDRIRNLSPEAAKKTMLLAEDKDIPDPVGQPQRVYNNCAELIEKAIKKRISELVI